MIAYHSDMPSMGPIIGTIIHWCNCEDVTLCGKVIPDNWILWDKDKTSVNCSKCKNLLKEV